MTKITCVKCGAKVEVEEETLKFSENLRPFECELCKKGVELGDLDKLKNFALQQFPGTVNIVNTIIENLTINYVDTLKTIEANDIKCFLSINEQP